MDRNRINTERSVRKLLIRHGYLLHTSRSRTDYCIMAPVKRFDTLEELKAYVDAMRYKMSKPIE